MKTIALFGGSVRTGIPFIQQAIKSYHIKAQTRSPEKLSGFEGLTLAKLIKQSGVDWTIVRGPMLAEDPGNGKIQVGNVGTVDGFKLSRKDLAGFILGEIESGDYINKMPFLVDGK